MARTKANNVEYEYRPGYTENWAQGGIEIQQSVCCAWPDRYRLKNDFLGTVAVVGKKLSRTLPEFHPEHNWLPCVNANLVNPEGAVKQTDAVNKFGFFFHQNGGLNKDGLAVFRMSFVSVPYRLFVDDFLHEKERFTWVEEVPSGEAVQTPGNTWKVVGAASPIQTANAISYFTKTVDVHWVQVAGWSQTDVEGLMNKTNQNAWSIDEYTYEPETLLLAGYKSEKRRSAAGQPLRDFVFHLLWKPLGWNKFYRPMGPVEGQGPGWYPVVSVHDGVTKPYPPAENGFDGLFSVFAPFGG